MTSSTPPGLSVLVWKIVLVRAPARRAVVRLNDTACANCSGLFMLEGEVSVTRNSERTMTHTAQGVGRECVQRSLREDSKT